MGGGLKKMLQQIMKAVMGFGTDMSPGPGNFTCAETMGLIFEGSLSGFTRTVCRVRGNRWTNVIKGEA